MSIARNLCVGIAGGSGSGKSTIAELLLIKFNGVIFSADNYYKDQSHLPETERATLNFDDPDMLDWELLLSDLQKLINNQSVDIPIYDFKTHARLKDKTQTVHPARFIFFEGIFGLNERARHLLDKKLYVHAEEKTFIERRVKRDVSKRGRDEEQARKQILDTVLPMHRIHVAPTQECADLTIDNNEEHNLESHLKERTIPPMLEPTIHLLSRKPSQAKKATAGFFPPALSASSIEAPASPSLTLSQ